MVFYDVNNTYVRVKENDVNAFYIKKSDVKKIELKDRFISVIGENGSTILKSIWNNIDVFDEDPDVNDYTVQNSGSPSPAPSAEDTLVAVHNAFFFRDGVGIDLEQLSNIEGQSADGYILVYDAEIQKWTPQPVMFNTDEAADLSSNVSGLSRGRLQLAIATDTETSISYRQLLFNDVSGVQHTIPLPSDLTETGQQENITVVCRNVDTNTIEAGMPVHFTGTQGTKNVEFIYADAANPNRMPAHGILSTQTTPNGSNGVVVFGTLAPLNTTAIDYDATQYPDGLEEGMTIYVKPGGGMTVTRPTSSSHLVQNMGQIESVESPNGKVLVTGPGRSNDIPNLANKNVFIGNGTSAYEKRQLTTSDIVEQSQLFFTDARARAAISAASGSTIEYNAATGQISIDDSNYGGVTQEEVISSFVAGNGISLDSAGNLSVKISGSNIGFDSGGNVIITGIPTHTSDLSNDGEGQSRFLTELEAAEMLGNTEDRFPPEPNIITLNMPTEGGVVKTFGKYKHNDPIVVGGKTVIDVLLDAFSDFVNPIPSINIDTRPDYNHQYTSFAFRIDVDFGVQNSGGVATGELFFKINSSGTYTSLGAISEGSNQTISPVSIGSFSSTNEFFFKLEVTEGSVTVTDEDSIKSDTRQAPTVNNQDISRVSTYSVTSNVGDLVREYGDLETTYEADIQGNEFYVSLNKVYFQYYNASSAWTTTGNQTLTSENVDNVQFTTPSGLTHSSLDTPSRIDARFLVESIEDGTETLRYNPYEFDDVKFYLAYAICFSSTALSPTSTDAEFQSIYDSLQGDDNGYKVKAVLTSSGTYPSKIPNTGNINNTAGNTYMYIIYPSTNPITSFLDGGVSPALAGLVDLGNHDVQNYYGYTHSLRFYRTGASGSINNTFFSIG